MRMMTAVLQIEYRTVVLLLLPLLRGAGLPHGRPYNDDGWDDDDDAVEEDGSVPPTSLPSRH